MAEQPLMQVENEGQNPFESKPSETENSEGSSPEENNGDQTPSSEGEQKTDAEKKDDKSDSPESKYKNWIPPERAQEREGDWKGRFNDQEVRHTDDLTKQREELQTEFDKKLAENKPPSAEGPIEVPSWFGGDENQWRSYKKHTDEIVANAVKEAVGQVNQRTEEEQKEVGKATEYMKQQLKEIHLDSKLNPDSKELDHNKIMKFTLDNYLIDDQGRWDYKKAFGFMKPADVFKAKSIIQKKENDKKEFVDALNPEHKAETKPQAFKTSADFKKPQNRFW